MLEENSLIVGYTCLSLNTLPQDTLRLFKFESSIVTFMTRETVSRQCSCVPTDQTLASVKLEKRKLGQVVWGLAFNFSTREAGASRSL